jgi:gliding motility-associated lipoprotein GldD
MKLKRRFKYIPYVTLIFILIGCKGNLVPKPRGYFRIDFPDKSYKLYDTLCPFVFEYPVYGRISYDVGRISKPCWFNIEFPVFSAKIHFSYFDIRNNLEEILDESHDFAYSHSIKADAITEQPWLNPGKDVYGVLYDIKGNTASSLQFYLTDSTKHFVRGALYFSVQPDQDSLLPVINFFREDIIHLVETFKWKNK